MKMLKLTETNGTLFCVNPLHVASLYPASNDSAVTVVGMSFTEDTDNMLVSYFVKESIEEILKQIEA